MALPSERKATGVARRHSNRRARQRRGRIAPYACLLASPEDGFARRIPAGQGGLVVYRLSDGTLRGIQLNPKNLEDTLAAQRKDWIDYVKKMRDALPTHGYTNRDE